MLYILLHCILCMLARYSNLGNDGHMTNTKILETAHHPFIIHILWPRVSYNIKVCEFNFSMRRIKDVITISMALPQTATNIGAYTYILFYNYMWNRFQKWKFKYCFLQDMTKCDYTFSHILQKS